jgi:hypothetical protein
VNSTQEVSSAPPFAALDSTLQRYFYKPDTQAIRIVLGAIKAHYLEIGDPAWLFVVAPPGSGKTTISIAGASGLPQVISLSDFTENTFLSGFYQHADAGLLERLGPGKKENNTYSTVGNGIFLAKDFTTVLSMRREKRAAILSQLREIHDGSFKRNFGTGEEKNWTGRVSIIAAVTPALDRHYSVFSTLGERFLQLRWHRPDSEEAGEWAIRQQGLEKKIQGECASEVKAIFDASLETPPELSSEHRTQLAKAAELTAIARTHVGRAAFGNREIEYVPEPEANTRISKGLAAIARGVAALNRRDRVSDADMQDALRVSLDCITDTRRRILLAAIYGEEPALVPMPRTVRTRQIEELEALELLEGADNRWTLTEKAQNLVNLSGLRAL